MNTIAPQAYRMILAAAGNLTHLARLHGVLPTLETEPRQPLAMGNHFLRLTLRPVRQPEPAAADNCRRPDLLEKLAYHEGARCDMSLEDCLSFLANGWTETPGRTYTQLVLQITELLAAAPAKPYCYSDCQAYTHGIEAELQALRKKVATYQARDALGLVPQPIGELGPDGKEWAKTAAGYAHVEAMLPRADGHQSVGPYWYGWALRGAFVAGAEWQEARNLPAPATAYAPLTIAEARDLTCMLAGAPWPDEMLPELQRLLGIYDGLRARGQRPVDPATLPRKVAKAVMKTGVLPDTAQAVDGALEEVNWVGTSSHHLLPRPSTSDATHPDDAAADRFVAAMKAKLAQARAKGRSGWDSPEQCSAEKLATMLVQHVAKGDPVDVANFAMMLHQRLALGIDPATNNRTAPLKMALGAYVESDGYWNGWGAQVQHLRDQVALALDEMGCCNYNSAAERLRHVHQETGAKAPAPSAALAEIHAAEVANLRALAATCYAGLGAECDLPEHWLDALNAAANGEPFTTAGLLPFKAEPSLLQSPTHSALDTIEQALRDYHFALDSRQHGGVAADLALNAISQAMGMCWKRGEEAARRAAQLEQQDKAA